MKLKINNAYFYLVLSVLVLSPQFLFGMTKSMWVTSWDLTSKAKIDEIIADATTYKIDRIMAEIRYRGDALYIPNKKDSTFYNPEPRSFLLPDSTEWDPLEYLISKAQNKDLEIHAWITTFVATTRKIEQLDSLHVFYQKPQWITHDFQKKSMDPNSYEGAFLDPGIHEVHTYLLKIIMDIAINYQIDGIHLDYIRYPGPDFGYSKISRQQYELNTHHEDPHSWRTWKENQVSNFIKEVSLSVKNNFPDLILSTAVFPLLDNAKKQYSQNWFEWLSKDYVDFVYIMAYTKDESSFETILDRAGNLGFNDKIVVGLRAWDNDNLYPVKAINKKIKASKKRKFSGVSFFSYSGLKKQGYFKKIK